jgi:cytochrome c oxidase subunit IV
MAKNKDAHHDEHRPNTALYWKVFGALMVLTVITVAISKVHLPKGPAIALGLAVACVKAGLVAAVFMHLWGGEKLIHKMLWITVACAAILVLPLIDGQSLVEKMTRREAVAEQKPADHAAHGAHAEPASAEGKH